MYQRFACDSSYLHVWARAILLQVCAFALPTSLPWLMIMTIEKAGRTKDFQTDSQWFVDALHHVKGSSMQATFDMAAP